MACMLSGCCISCVGLALDGRVVMQCNIPVIESHNPSSDFVDLTATSSLKANQILVAVFLLR
jgi:hypothetical protein